MTEQNIITPILAPVSVTVNRIVFGRRERLALVVGALIMLAIVAASAVIARRTEADLGRVEAARSIRAATVNVLEAVMSAESGQRGYLLTGQPAYLEPYQDAVARLPDMMGRISQGLWATPVMHRWRLAIDDKMTELGQTVRLEQMGQNAQALALVLTDRGRYDMVLIRAVADSLAISQRNVVGSSLEHSRRGARLLVLIDAVALLQLLLLAAFVASSLRNTVSALRISGAELGRANAALQAGSERLESAVAERTEELTRANEEIQRFAYIVSHDLRAPLLNIIGFTSELENATSRLNRFVSDNLEPAGIVVPVEVREASRDDLPEAIRFIQTSTAKMDRLITAILRLSREGRRVITPERLDVAALVRGVFSSVQHQADAAGATLTAGPLPPLISDRVVIEQVFSNLVENALKYVAPGRPPLIRVSGGIAGGLARYEVGDNGRGVAERDRERIFELFRRAGQQDTTGEGIGLAHVRILLRRLGGTIDCTSALGEGSTFIVQLPAVLALGSVAMVEEAVELR